MKKTVKLQLDKRHYTKIEVEESQISQVAEHNRAVWRAAKREIRHESLYSLETLTETDRLHGETPSAEEEYIAREEKRERSARLHQALARLNARQRKMVKMVYFENKTQDEVAACFGVTKSAVSHAMERIYASLKKYLEEK